MAWDNKWFTLSSVKDFLIDCNSEYEGGGGMSRSLMKYHDRDAIFVRLFSHTTV